MLFLYLKFNAVKVKFPFILLLFLIKVYRFFINNKIRFVLFPPQGPTIVFPINFRVTSTNRLFLYSYYKFIYLLFNENHT
jgi:hypothetical protein